MSACKPVIGLAGGIGAGKSAVAEILGGLGAAVIASDRLNHEELNTPEVVEQLRTWWGAGVVRPDGQADRDALRRIIADDAEARRRLEGLMHPRIARRCDVLMARHRADPAVRAIVWDSPLLFEAGLANQCDCVVFVDADREIRLDRLVRNRGGSAEQWDKLEKTQKPLDFKRACADYRIENNSNIETLRQRVREVFIQILSGH